MPSMREMARMAAAKEMSGGGAPPGGAPDMPPDDAAPQDGGGGGGEEALAALEASIPPEMMAEAQPHIEALRAMLGGGGQEMPETAPMEGLAGERPPPGGPEA